MDYLDYFGFTSEPFGHAPLPRFYYASEQHTNALSRLMHAANAMKGLAVLLGDIGRGKTTLARRMLDSLPESQFEAAMLVIVHKGITPNWLLKRIALQVGVPDPADDKLTILSQLYQRLVQIHQTGRKAVVLIDEAQMLSTQDVMEEFRGLLNLEVPGHKLISFVFFGLPSLARCLELDPPLAQRVAIRCQLGALAPEDTANYVQHRMRLSGGDLDIFTPEALAEVHRHSAGVPRLINSLCDNTLLELFFGRQQEATVEVVAEVAQNLSLPAGVGDEPPAQPEIPKEPPAIEGGPGSDAIVAIASAAEEASAPEPASGPIGTMADDIAARVANEDPEPAPAAGAPAELPPKQPQGLSPALDLPGHQPVDPSIPELLDQPEETQPDDLDIADPLAFIAGEHKDEAAVEETVDLGAEDLASLTVDLATAPANQNGTPPIQAEQDKPPAVDEMDAAVVAALNAGGDEPIAEVSSATTATDEGEEDWIEVSEEWEDTDLEDAVVAAAKAAALDADVAPTEGPQPAEPPAADAGAEVEVDDLDQTPTADAPGRRETASKLPMVFGDDALADLGADDIEVPAFDEFVEDPVAEAVERLDRRAEARELSEAFGGSPQATVSLESGDAGGEIALDLSGAVKEASPALAATISFDRTHDPEPSRDDTKTLGDDLLGPTRNGSDEPTPIDALDVAVELDESEPYVVVEEVDEVEDGATMAEEVAVLDLEADPEPVVVDALDDQGMPPPGASHSAKGKFPVYSDGTRHPPGDEPTEKDEVFAGDDKPRGTKGAADKPPAAREKFDDGGFDLDLELEALTGELAKQEKKPPRSGKKPVRAGLAQARDKEAPAMSRGEGPASKTKPDKEPATKSKAIDLGEIDDLLADLKR